MIGNLYFNGLVTDASKNRRRKNNSRELFTILTESLWTEESARKTAGPGKFKTENNNHVLQRSVFLSIILKLSD